MITKMFFPLLILLQVLCFTGAIRLWRKPNLRRDDIPSRDMSFGYDNMTTVLDPKGSGESVLKVLYPRNSYKPSSRPRGGAQFFVPLNSSRTDVTLTYDLLFASNFDFKKGGKLPGLYGGGRKCSGGRDSSNCFSTRYMWRRVGDGEVYFYGPNQTAGFCDLPKTVVNCGSGHRGISLGRKSWRFATDRWYTLRQRVRLNDVNRSNGRVTVWLDDVKKFDLQNLIFRNSDNVKIDGMYFSTFFGGGDPSWATPQDTNTYYRNFEMTTP